MCHQWLIVNSINKVLFKEQNNVSLHSPSTQTFTKIPFVISGSSWTRTALVLTTVYVACRVGWKMILQETYYNLYFLLKAKFGTFVTLLNKTKVSFREIVFFVTHSTVAYSAN